MKITGNEPAFNKISHPDNYDQEKWNGLTIRQQFAMAAMQGILASDWGKAEAEKGKTNIMISQVTRASVLIADNLIEELNKDQFSTKCNP